MSGKKDQTKICNEADVETGFAGNDCLTRAGELYCCVGQTNTGTEQAMNEIERAVTKAMQAMPWSGFVTATLLVLLCHLFLVTDVGAGGPTEQVRATVDKVLTIVRSPNANSKTQKVARRAQLVAVIYPGLTSRRWPNVRSVDTGRAGPRRNNGNSSEFSRR